MLLLTVARHDNQMTEIHKKSLLANPQNCQRSETEVLEDALKILRDKLFRQIQNNKVKSKLLKDADTDLNDIDLMDAAKEINPLIWNFVHRLLETQKESKKRWKQDGTSFDWTNHYMAGETNDETLPRKVPQVLYNICHTLFTINSQCCYPLHLHLGETTKALGGSDVLMTIDHTESARYHLIS